MVANNGHHGHGEHWFSMLNNAEQWPLLGDEKQHKGKPRAMDVPTTIPKQSKITRYVDIRFMDACVMAMR